MSCTSAPAQAPVPGLWRRLLPSCRRSGTARRAAPRPPPHLRRRQGRKGHPARAAGQAGPRHALEHTQPGRSRGHLPQHCAAVVLPVRGPAALGEDVPAVQRLPFSSRKSWILQGSISTRPTTRWCSAWTRSPRSRRSTAPSRRFRWTWATAKATPTTTFGTARRRSSPRWTSPPGRGSRRARSGVGTRTSWRFWH